MRNTNEPNQHDTDLYLAKNTSLILLLEEYRWHENQQVRLNVVQNPNTPGEFLLSICSYDHDSTVRMLATETIVKRNMLSEAIKLTKRTNTPSDVLRILAMSGNELFDYEAAGHEGLDGETLAQLSREKGDIRLAVAQNPSTPLSVLLEMSKMEDHAIWQGLVQNPAAPVELIQSWMARLDRNQDEQSRVVTSLASHRLETGHVIYYFYDCVCPSGLACPMYSYLDDQPAPFIEPNGVDEDYPW